MAASAARRLRFRIAALGLLCALGSGLSGCAPTPEGLVREQVRNFNDLADAIESGAEKASLDSFQDRIRETNRKLDELGLSAEAKAKLLGQNREEFAKAAKRVSAATLKRGFNELGKGVSQGLFGQ